MPERNFHAYYLKSIISIGNLWRTFLMFLLIDSHSLFAFHQEEIYLLSPTLETELEIDTTGKENITIAIETKDLQQDLQGKIPVKFVLNSEDITFENGKHELLWHSTINPLGEDSKISVSHSPFIYLPLTIDDRYFGRTLKVQIKKEEDISKFSSIAAFLPQMIPIILMGDVTWGPAPIALHDLLMKLNFKVLETDIIKSTREFILSSYFGKHRSLSTKCFASFFEGFLLFSAANYGESSGNQRGKIETFRLYMMSSPFKSLMNCMSDTILLVLLDIQKNQISEQWPSLKRLNRESIHGLSKLIVGYYFNAFVFQTGDLLKAIKQTTGFSYAVDDAKLQIDLDRSIVKAAQSTIHSGYEEFFKGLLKLYHLNEIYAFPLAVGAGVMEIIWRLYAHHNMQGRDRLNQIDSSTKRALAMSASINKAPIMEGLDDVQLLIITVAIPVLLYGFLSITNQYNTYPETVFAVINSIYEGVVLSGIIHVISPILHQYGQQISHTVQKKVLDYLESEPGSWSQYIMADNIRYRINIFAENQ